jgi:hypothetical protein
VGDYFIDVFKDDEMVHSIAGKWKDDGEAGAMAAYYLGLHHADSVRLYRERTADGRPAQDELVWEMFQPVGSAAGKSILW